MDAVILKVVIKESQKQLDTLRLPQQTTLAMVRRCIVEKHKDLLMKSLVISEKHCKPMMVSILHLNRQS